MVETGVIGAEVFESESSGVSVGRSASELHESVSSRVTSKSSDVGGSVGGIVPTPLPVAVGGSASTKSTTTMVDSTRILAGALPAAALAIVADLLFAALERTVATRYGGR